jgi:hypothetical protein
MVAAPIRAKAIRIISIVAIDRLIFLSAIAGEHDRFDAHGKAPTFVQ